MLKKRTKIIILVAMVLLLGVTGYLNIALNNRVVDAGSNTTVAMNYFDSYRADRNSTREQELLIYDSIIADAASTAEEVADAKAKKQTLVAQMEQELALEYSIKGLGYADAIVTSTDNSINVFVSATSEELGYNEVMKILNLVKDQTDYTNQNLKVIPV